jgi:signal transduction histidine kinase
MQECKFCKSQSIVKSGGTGLRLSIVKHICSLYGWNLSLKSKPGVGTEVIIDFFAFTAQNLS